MASADFLRWQARVKADGGRITVAPSGTSAVAYPMEAWAAKVNGGVWPLPQEYSKNGQTAYYHVPPQFAKEIAAFGKATQAEAERAGKQLMQQWNIPSFLQSLGNFRNAILITVIAGGVAWYILRKR